jgi:hypothetical protein
VVNYCGSVIVTTGSTPIFYMHYIGIFYPEAILYISIYGTVLFSVNKVSLSALSPPISTDLRFKEILSEILAVSFAVTYPFTDDDTVESRVDVLSGLGKDIFKVVYVESAVAVNSSEAFGT